MAEFCPAQWEPQERFSKTVAVGRGGSDLAELGDSLVSLLGMVGCLPQHLQPRPGLTSLLLPPGMFRSPRQGSARCPAAYRAAGTAKNAAPTLSAL